MSIPGVSEFVAVIDAGSFTRAAEKLGTSKSNLSQQISKLEQRLGIQLMHRTTRSIRMTDVGENFYRQSKHGLSILDQAIAQAKEQQNSLSGRIRINSVGGLFGEQILAPAILGFMEQHPEVKIDLDFASNHIDLMAEHFDIAVRMGSLPDSSLVGRTIREKPSYLVATPSYIEKHGAPTHPDELSNHRLICGSLKRWRFSKGNEKAEVLLEGALCCPNGHVQLLAVEKNQGISRLPDYYTQRGIDDGNLVALLPDWTVNPTPVSLVYPKVRFKIRRVQALVEYLIHWFEEHPAL